MSEAKDARPRLFTVQVNAYDLYASAAMLAISAHAGPLLANPEVLAAEAFAIADAMMLERLPPPFQPKEPEECASQSTKE